MQPGSFAGHEPLNAMILEREVQSWVPMAETIRVVSGVNSRARGKLFECPVGRISCYAI